MRDRETGTREGVGSRMNRGRRSGVCVRAWLLLIVSGLIVAAGAQKEPEKPTDMQIENAVESALLLDDAVQAHLIDITSNEGIVTLTGPVGDLLQKRRAVKLARTVRGVRSVVNRIDVRPVIRSEKDIRTDVLEALAADPATESYEIDVAVQKATVTLSGTVNSYAERQLAEKVVRGVKGVKEIANTIAVEYDTDRSDNQIKADIERRLAIDPYVPDKLVDVAVGDGKVTVTGTVGSAAEKNAVREAAWVTGVQDVDVSALQVQWWALRPQERESKTVIKTDDAIEKAVTDALAFDPRAISFNFDVSSEDGVVTIEGTVDNLKAKRAALSDARNTTGVVGVNDRIRVRFTEEQPPPDDAELTDNVSAAMLRDPVLERHEIRPVVRNARVSLYGDVDSYFEKWHAEEVVSRVRGVADVHNVLTVSRSWRWKSDEAIAQDIRRELYWSLEVDQEDIEVEVRNGTASMSGSVNDLSELDVAVDKAFDGGARVVRSTLDVGGYTEYEEPVYYYHKFYRGHSDAL